MIKRHMTPHTQLASNATESTLRGLQLVQQLQQLSVGRFHYRLLVAVGLGWLFDAMDTGLIAFIIPRLAESWQLTVADKALVVSIGFIGMAIGAVIAGALADRFGRKTVLCGTLLLYGAATAACGVVPTISGLLVCRFLVGLGLGGQLPVAVSLVSEYVPTAVRGRFIVLLESFWGLGWLAAALIAYGVIPTYGWQPAFLIGGLPFIYAIYLWRLVPESIPYLVEQGRLAEATAIVNRITAGDPCTAVTATTHVIEAGDATAVTDADAVTASRGASISLRSLWSTGFARRTLMLWLIWFGIVFSYYGIFTWLPSLLMDRGFPIVKSFEFTLILILAQLPGYMAAAWLIERWGRKQTLAGFIALCAVCAHFFGAATSDGAIILWGCLLSFFNLGAWGVLYTYTPEQYPTTMRAYGSGWASAIGRLGGIAAPPVVTHLMMEAGAFTRVFTMFTLVLTAVAVIIVVLGRETRGRSLMETGCGDEVVHHQ